MIPFHIRTFVGMMLAAAFMAACASATTPTLETSPQAPAVTLLPSPTIPVPTIAQPITTSPAPIAVPTILPSTEAAFERSDRMKIRIKLEDSELIATLDDSQTTQEFLALLPLTLTLEDYAGTEKVSDLPERLSTEGAPAGSDPSVGDITYYAPWGNLAIFYNDFGYANGLIILGKIDGDMEALSGSSQVNVRIERID